MSHLVFYKGHSRWQWFTNYLLSFKSWPIAKW